MVKTQPLNGIQSIDSVGKRDKLDSDQGIVGASIVNIALSFLAATDDRGEQGAGAELHNVAVVEQQKENVELCAHAQVKGKQLLELNKVKEMLMVRTTGIKKITGINYRK